MGAVWRDIGRVFDLSFMALTIGRPLRPPCRRVLEILLPPVGRDVQQAVRIGQVLDPAGEAGASRMEITAEELGALLSGIDLSAATRRKRYRRAKQ